jgi:hypothetical protein
MRSILIGLIALAVSCVPAFAQTIHPGAQRFAHIALVDTGLFDQAIDVAGKQLAPQFRQGLLGAPWMSTLDEEKRPKVIAYVDTIPGMLFAALREELPAIETAVAAAYSKEWTPEQADKIADFFSSRDGLAFFKVTASLALDAYADNGRRPSAQSIMARLTPEQVSSVNAFARTPSGRAFSRVGGGKASTIMRDAIAKDVMPKRIPELRAKLRGDLCAIIGEPCPVPALP